MKIIQDRKITCSCGKRVRYFLIADEEGTSAFFVRSNSDHTGPAIKRCPKCHKKLS